MKTRRTFDGFIITSCSSEFYLKFYIIRSIGKRLQLCLFRGQPPADVYKKKFAPDTASFSSGSETSDSRPVS
jgi:hypothetical protein